MKKTKTLWLIIFLFSLGFSQVQKDPFNQMGDVFDELEGKLSLYFLNALNGKPIPSAKVKMDGIGEFSTDAQGKIQFKIPEDAFARIPVSVRKSGFTNTDFTLELLAGTLFLNRFSISPSIPLKHMRVVLDWGENPRDLDAHLVKKDSYHISYRHKKKAADGVAILDRDDTNGFGPETITVTSLDYNGEYEYYVEDFSNRNKKSSDKLSKSRGEVKVYGKGKLLHYFRVPQNKKGDTWTIFKIKNGEVIPVNNLGSR
jgi:hypothetical protein